MPKAKNEATGSSRSKRRRRRRSRGGGGSQGGGGGGKIRLGDKVVLVNSKGGHVGTVRSVCANLNGTTDFLVSWFSDDGNRYQSWLGKDELEKTKE